MNTAEPAPTSDGGGGAAAAAAAAATAAASSNPSAIVPQLAEHGITEEDLATAIRVLDAISSLDPKRRRKKRKNGNESKKRKGAPSEKDGDGQSDGDCNNEVNNNKKEGAEEGGGSEDGLSLYRKPNLRPFRKALSQTLSLHKMTMYEGQSEEQYYEKRIAERTLKRQKMSERAMQRKYVANTDLRRGRVEKLERLRQEEGRDEEEGKVKLLEYLIPDGHVDTATATIGNEDGGVKMLENGNAPEPGAKQSSNGDGATESAGGGEEPTILPKQRSCYSCKVRFRVLHHFYDQLCPTCAPLNFDKRHQSIDMSGKVAVVTGSRVKIGFQVCLKLLRAGCEVVATTRFPNNAVAAYRKEKDFGVWKGRLHVYALDLRDVTGLEAFTRYLKGLYGERGVDVLINNACQTVRRPGGYYVPLVERERDLWSSADDDHRDVLGGCREFERVRRRLVDEQQRQSSDGGAGRGNGMLPAGPTVGKEKLLLDAPGAAQTENDGQKSADSQIVTATDNQSAVPFESTGISHSAAMSQMPILPEDVGIDPEIMPPNLSDINGHQLDLRTHNSWLLKMDEVRPSFGLIVSTSVQIPTCVLTPLFSI